MDVQDHNKHPIPSGHGSHGVHLCHRCGWPFPNPHPSSRQRRSHKKICGTIDGYTNLIHSEVVSDDEHHPDDDKDKSPSPKIEKKTSIGGGDGAIGRSFSRSEDDSFSDAVTEFADTTSTRSVNKALDRDLFFSFKDAENEMSKVDSSEDKSELPDSVKDGVVEPKVEQSDVSHSHEEAAFIDVVGAGAKLETVTADGINEEIKNENLESEGKHVSETVKEAEQVHELVSEVAKESEIGQKLEGVGEETKHEKIELDHENVSEVVKEPEIVESVSENCSNEHTHEVIEESDAVLIEKYDFGGPKLEKESSDQFQETVVVLTENTDLGTPKSENCSTEEIDEVVKEPKSVFENPNSVLTEKEEDLGSPIILEKTSNEEDTMEVVQEPISTLIEKEDVGAPKSEYGSTEVVNEPVTDLTQNDDLDAEKCSNKQSYEVVEDPTVLTEKDDKKVPILENIPKEQEPNSNLTEKDDLGAPILENIAKEQEPNSNLIEKEDLGAPKSEEKHTHEVLEDPVTKEDIGEQILPKEDAKEVTKEPKVDNCIVSEPIIATNQDSGFDLSIDSGSRNSLEGNWGSVSVLSTASVDDKPKKIDNQHSGNTSDAFEAPSFMTLVDPQVKDEKKPEVQDAQKAGWFPTITNVSNESEGRKKNEEVIAKVTNWTTENNNKHSTPLKNLLGEAKSPKEPELESKPKPQPMTVKDEGEKQEMMSSPPKLIEDGKKGGKKVKGRSSWMPFVCCSSVNVVK
ncbi:hypothetical protein LXL04_004083 [Taraxacum kok-saghyz]